MDHIAMALPRSVGMKRSATVPPPIVTAADPAIPARNLNPMSILRFELTAQATVKIRKKRFVILYRGIRPKSSERGACKDNQKLSKSVSRMRLLTITIGPHA